MLCHVLRGRFRSFKVSRGRDLARRRVVQSLVLVVLAIGTKSVYGANLKGQLVLEQPYCLNSPVADGQHGEVKIKGKTMPNQAWVVFADRDGTLSYSEPNGTEQFKTLRFMQQLFVLERDGEWFHVVKSAPAPEALVFGPHAEDYGWVHRQHLLLWRYALVTPRGKIKRKAMILNTVEHLKRTDDSDPDLVRFLSSPFDRGVESGHESGLFSFFFVYKQEGNWILLGKQGEVPDNPTRRRESMVGWAPRDRITQWDSRVAVEPNYDPSSLARRASGEPVSFFVEKRLAENYGKGKSVEPEDILWTESRLPERPIGEWRRFPVLELHENKNVMKAGVIGEVVGGGGRAVGVSPEQLAAWQRELDHHVARTRNVNVVFVIDGTRSMGPYFPAVAEAIQESMGRLRSAHSDNNFKFAAVVYRDYAEEDIGKLVEQVRLTDDADKVADFLKGIEAGDTNNRTLRESVNKGMQYALRASGLARAEHETNIMILIGDVGNHLNDTRVTVAELVDQLDANQVHLCVFQVHHGGDPAYEDFLEQAAELVMLSALREHSALALAYGSKSILEPEWQVTQGAVELLHGTRGGWISPLEIGESMSERELKRRTVRFINEVEAKTNARAAQIKELIEGGLTAPSAIVATDNACADCAAEFPPHILKILHTMGVESAQLSTIGEQKYQLYTQGWAPLKRAEEGDLFKRVLLLDRRELSAMVHVMGKLHSTVSGADERKRLYDTWIQVLQDYLGESEFPMAGDLSFEQLNDQVFGLPGNSDLLDMKLKDILNLNEFSDADLRKYVNRVKAKHRTLLTVFNDDNYPYAFRSDEVPYYWIDEEFIP